MKDETRNTFSTFLDNLPQINNSSKGGGNTTTANNKGGSPAPGGSAQVVSKKVKRKASIPAPTSAPRMAQSVGASVLNTDGSQDDIVTAAKTNNASVTKGTTGRTNKSSSQYPSYFFTPKENVFESKRASKLDKSNGKPQAFHLTQPDTNLAKFVFLNKESKKTGRGP